MPLPIILHVLLTTTQVATTHKQHPCVLVAKAAHCKLSASVFMGFRTWIVAGKFNHRWKKIFNFDCNESVYGWVKLGATNKDSKTVSL